MAIPRGTVKKPSDTKVKKRHVMKRCGQDVKEVRRTDGSYLNLLITRRSDNQSDGAIGTRIFGPSPGNSGQAIYRIGLVAPEVNISREIFNIAEN